MNRNQRTTKVKVRNCDDLQAPLKIQVQKLWDTVTKYTDKERSENIWKRYKRLRGAKRFPKVFQSLLNVHVAILPGGEFFYGYAKIRCVNM